MTNKLIFEEDFYFDDLGDISESILDCISYGDFQPEQDENGVFKGCYKVTITYVE